MPSVLVIDSASEQHRPGLLPGVRIDVQNSTTGLEHQLGFDLLVLSGLRPAAHDELVDRLHRSPAWRIVPILYVHDGSSGGLTVPASYRPELDSLARGPLDSVAVQRRIREMARDGVAGAAMLVAGPYQLDPVRNVLSAGPASVRLTARESAILGALLASPNRTLAGADLVRGAWKREPAPPDYQILRRHVSNLRRKLSATPARSALQTVRGSGYRLVIEANAAAA